MKRKLIQFCATILLLILSTAIVGFAQSDTARLSGTITDQQGAAVSGASVTVTSTGTGRQSAVTTNDLGYYSVSALPAGNYHVEVTQRGFKKTARDFELQVAQLAVVDFQLEVGAQTQTVVVEAGAPVLNTEDSSIVARAWKSAA